MPGTGRRRDHQDEGLVDAAPSAAQVGHDRRRVAVARPRSSNGLRVTKITPALGALVKVAPSKPAKVTVCAAPAAQRMIAEALRITASVRSSVAPGGSWIAVMR